MCEGSVMISVVGGRLINVGKLVMYLIKTHTGSTDPLLFFSVHISVNVCVM